MKPLVLILTLSSGLMVAGTALADVDCTSPMSDWQPREAAVAHVATLGITVDRLRIDDGCYELRGRDAEGNRVALQLDPATLEVRNLEVRFGHGADASRYFPGRHGDHD